MTDQSATSNGHLLHTTIDGDRWDMLAWRYYGDQHRQTDLIEANRHLFVSPLIVPPMILPSGMELIIPVIDDEVIVETDLPPWKRSG